MMLGKKTKVPKAPNFQALAAQDNANAMANWQKGLTANRADQVGPQGSLNWAQDSNGNWTQTVTENPIYDALRKSQVAGYQTAADKANTAIGNINTDNLDYSKAPTMPTVGGFNQQVIDSIRALQNPQLQRARASKEAQLAAMGVGTGSGQVWSDTQRDLGNAESDADMKAILQGISQGNTEYGQQMQAHQQGVSDINQARQGDIATAGALAGLSPDQGDPTFASYFTQGAPTPESLMNAGQLGYNAALNKANAQNSDANGWLGLLKSGIGAAGSIFGGPAGGTAANWLTKVFGSNAAPGVNVAATGGSPGVQLDGTNWLNDWWKQGA
jgi:hypothetical protein